MKACAVALALIVIIGFSVIGMVIYSAFPHDSKKAWFILHTDKMSEADSSAADTAEGPSVIATYFADRGKPGDSSISAADIFICASVDKADRSKTDTVLLLDTRLLNGSEGLDHPEKYWTQVKSARKLKECGIRIPENLVKKVRTYKYRYGRVALMMEDGEE
ncbi:MAG TPA: hypothetical protein VFE53_23530 [Mucilaginibacter sp.]|jgi:hypothetical protein|nr:hypothetical protein [Mucilaginibacter sp.]